MSTDVQECGVIQVIDPDTFLPVASGGAIWDPALVEFGEVILTSGQSVVTVVFQTLKLNASYKFDYLYVDDIALPVGTGGSGAVVPVITSQTVAGFVVELAGVPLDGNYVLRWRVVVVSALTVPNVLDAPENLYLQLPHADPDNLTQLALFNILFVNPRSNTAYGFSELRVENLVDDPTIQTPVAIQVWEKRVDGFQIAMSPIPPTANYFLAVRTP